MQKVSASKLFSEKMKIELYPPFFLMRVKVLEISRQWRTVRMKLPLNTVSRNPGGVMFGGYQAALADPIAALACSRIFPGYSCWTRAMSLDFSVGGSKDLELRFEFPPELEKSIRADLDSKGRSTPTFKYGYYLPDGTLSTSITNVVAIRKSGYIRATTPPAKATQFAAPSPLQRLDSILRDKILKIVTRKYLSGEPLLVRSFEELVRSVARDDGVLTRSELHALLARVDLDGHFSDDQVDDIFDLLDRDRDGVVSVAHAAEWWRGGGGSPREDDTAK